MKKILSLAVSAVLAVSVLAGCSSATSSKTSGKEYKDGTYKATYDYMDGKGWKPQVEIVVKGKKIDKVTFDYVNAKGDLKSKDATYNEKMKAVAKTNPAEYCPKFGESLVKTQDVDKVDAITGATHSFENFKALAKAALAKAEKGDTSATTLVMNDTYTASAADFDQYGWKAQVSITYKDGKITAVKYDEVNKDKKLKSEDKDYNDKMKAASKISAAEAYAKLSENAMNNKFDTVAGATSTSKTFKTLYDQAVAMRK